VYDPIWDISIQPKQFEYTRSSLINLQVSSLFIMSYYYLEWFSDLDPIPDFLSTKRNLKIIAMDYTSFSLKSPSQKLSLYFELRLDSFNSCKLRYHLSLYLEVQYSFPTLYFKKQNSLFVIIPFRTFSKLPNLYWILNFHFMKI